jgi:hypothetical protein
MAASPASTFSSRRPRTSSTARWRGLRAWSGGMVMSRIDSHPQRSAGGAVARGSQPVMSWSSTKPLARRGQAVSDAGRARHAPPAHAFDALGAASMRSCFRPTTGAPCGSYRRGVVWRVEEGSIPATGWATSPPSLIGDLLPLHGLAVDGASSTSTARRQPWLLPHFASDGTGWQGATWMTEAGAARPRRRRGNAARPPPAKAGA